MKTSDGSFYGITPRKAIILIIALTSLVYANSLFNSFVWDDYLVIVDNDFIKSWKNFPLIFTRDYITNPYETDYLGFWGIGSGEITYRPVVTASYFIDYAIWKLNPFGYHLANLILHIFNVLLLYIFMGVLMKNRNLALLASLLFALHPVNTEAVNCISFREDLLAFLFFIASFIIYIGLDNYKGKKRLFAYCISIALFLLALFSKEMAITLPALLILYDYLFVFEKSFKKTFCIRGTRYIGYFLAILAYLWAWAFFKGYFDGFFTDFSYRGGSFYANILTIMGVFVTYMGWLVFPMNRYPTLPEHDPATAYSILEPRIFISLMLIVACLVVAAHSRRKSEKISYGIFWFFIALFPVSNIFPIANVMASRFLYLPAIGFFIVMTTVLDNLQKVKIPNFNSYARWKAIRIIIITLFFSYSMFTVIRNMSWKNNIMMWQELVEKYPDSAEAHRSLGQFLAENGIFDRAISEYELAIELDPVNAKSYNGLGLCYYNKGMVEEAMASFNRALEMDPYSLDAYNGLGNIFSDKGLDDEAIGYFKQAIAIDPRYMMAYENLGGMYVKIGEIDKARETWKKALDLNPDYKELNVRLERLNLALSRP